MRKRWEMEKEGLKRRMDNIEKKIEDWKSREREREKEGRKERERERRMEERNLGEY